MGYIVQSWRITTPESDLEDVDQEIQDFLNARDFESFEVIDIKNVRQDEDDKDVYPLVRTVILIPHKPAAPVREPGMSKLDFFKQMDEYQSEIDLDHQVDAELERGIELLHRVYPDWYLDWEKSRMSYR